MKNLISLMMVMSLLAVTVQPMTAHAQNYIYEQEVEWDIDWDCDCGPVLRGDPRVPAWVKAVCFAPCAAKKAKDAVGGWGVVGAVVLLGVVAALVNRNAVPAVQP